MRGMRGVGLLALVACGTSGEEARPVVKAAPPATDLMGQCAFNRSDDRLLGRITQQTPAPGGQQRLTVKLVPAMRDASGSPWMDVTYPRNARADACPETVD